ncbi:MAG: Asp-tRNA(Asn)/Glu-tRNA(Gln) amidotransferase subunit GatB [Planctomycetes bacterium]|nr:Asp-tRNA(Asn)/Glu-tRNA(Gln) amidotransferase subunit GatB [Planctomycetota bacterium]
MTTPAITSTRLKIGMEIHVELATRSKMFSRSPNLAHPDYYDAAPNSLVDPLVAALPGALPVMNKRAVELAMMVGLAINCSIAKFTKWDRKNYFYPDLPKGYQISQYDLPLCFDGEVHFTDVDGTTKRVGIIRAHLEEDAGKLGHELPGGKPYDGSLVDLNRAGTPLLEIVTHPDLASAADAVIFAKELRNICRFLGASEGIMQRGHMRFEPNVNVIIETDDGREYATPIVEVKNLNSFRAVHDAIEYEHHRQVEAWKSDGIVDGPGLKSTRGWNDAKRTTVLQREKEESHDYRYFPDPDLIPVVVSDTWRQEIASRIPQLPMQRRARYKKDYDLSAEDATALTDERDLCLFYERCVKAIHTDGSSDITGVQAGQACAKLLLNAGAKRAHERSCPIHELGITPEQISQLILLRDSNAIGSSSSNELFALLCKTDDDAQPVAERAGLMQVSDEGQLDEWIEQAIQAQPQAADDFSRGKDAALGRLVGEVMKLSRGQAEAKSVQAKLRDRLRGD